MFSSGGPHNDGTNYIMATRMRSTPIASTSLVVIGSEENAIVRQA